MKLRPVFALLVSLGLVSSALGWGGDGHQTVALIAEAHLTSKATAQIKELLDGAEISYAEVASWADNVRRERRETAPWHYVDIPTTQPSFDRQRDSHAGDNVIDKIADFEKVLADTKLPKAQRAEALKYLVHFIGDLHQPLHAAERDGDKGGNKRLVFFLDRERASNLHSVWDSAILISVRGETRIVEYASNLDKRITPEQAKAWAQGTSEDWANESHNVALEAVYAGVPVDGPPPRLDQAYVDKAGKVVEEQLERAGIRLAMVLNRALSDQTSPASESAASQPSGRAAPTTGPATAEH